MPVTSPLLMPHKDYPPNTLPWSNLEQESHLVHANGSPATLGSGAGMWIKPHYISLGPQGSHTK